MTDIKISALPTIAQGSVGVATDSIPITQGAVTYKVTPTALVFSSINANSTGSGSVVLSTSPVINAPTGIVKADVGLGNVDNTSDATKNAATATLTNKTLTNPSYSGATANAGTVTTIDINGGTVDGAVIGGAVPAAGSFTSLNASGIIAGRATNGQVLGASNGVDADIGIYLSTGIAQISSTAASGKIRTTIGGSTVTDVSSTGLSVTGGISSTGDVGVGTTSPDVFARGDARTLGVSSSGSSSIGVNAATGSLASVYVGVNGTRSGQMVADATSLSVIAGNGKVLKLGANFVDQATLDASGNLGLGVVPSAWNAGKTLQISGNSGIYGVGWEEVGTYQNVIYNSGFLYGASGLQASMYTAYLGSHTWLTAPSGTAGQPISFTQAMTLTAGGNLLVGTTSSYGAKASIDMSGNGIRLRNVSAAGTPYAIAFDWGVTNVGSISITASATSYLTTSDARLKNNIADSADPASLIDALQVRQFDWLSDGSHQRYGFVAQELYEVAPEAVSKPQDPDEMMAVDYSKLVPMLVKEIQSLRARVSQLEGI
jgi:hypothetical protein